MKRDAAFVHLILTMYGEESKKDSSSFSKLGTWPRLAMYAVLGSIHHEKIPSILPRENGVQSIFATLKCFHCQHS